MVWQQFREVLQSSWAAQIHAKVQGTFITLQLKLACRHWHTVSPLIWLWLQERGRNSTLTCSHSNFSRALSACSTSWASALISACTPRRVHLPSQLSDSLRITAVKVRADSVSDYSNSHKEVINPLVYTERNSNRILSLILPELAQHPNRITDSTRATPPTDVFQDKPAQVQCPIKHWGSGASHCHAVSMSILMEHFPGAARKLALLLLMPSANCKQQRLPKMVWSCPL